MRSSVIEPRTVPNIVRPVASGLALGMAIGAFGLDHDASAASQPHYLADVHALQTPGVAPEVSRFFSKRIGSILSLGCSVSFIEDIHDEPVGVQLAGHCLKNTTLVYTKNKLPQVHVPGLLLVTGGNSYAETGVGNVPVGVVTKLFINGRDERDKDIVVGAFNGRSIKRVMALAKAVQAPSDDLPQGTTVYASGVPGQQPEIAPGHLRRKELPLQVLGSADVNMQDHHRMHMLITGVSQNDQAAKCRPGFSGGGMAREDTGITRPIGTMIGSIDLSQFKNTYAGVRSQDAIESYFGASVDQYVKLCLSSNALPDKATGGYAAKVVVDAGEPPAGSKGVINSFQETEPDQLSPDSNPSYSEQATTEELVADSFAFQSAGNKSIVHGIVRLPNHYGNGPDAYVRDPALRIFPATGHLVLDYCVSYDASGSCETPVTQSISSAEALQAYAGTADGTVNILHIDGKPEPVATPESRTGAYRDDKTGTLYGMQLDDEPARLGSRYTVTIDNTGNIQAIPRVVPVLPSIAPSAG